MSPGKRIEENNRHIDKIERANELMADSPLNPYGEDIGVLFQYNRDYMAIEIPKPPTMRPPHMTLKGFQVLNEARSGGMFIKQPLSALIVRGI